ncbi:hypothetical protein X759_24445 [Mesorhizobium sp. LSHC420B00]|nr:hypothetical protein X759_24445 [Mesorhizobium sp. LSHC420B00]
MRVGGQVEQIVGKLKGKPDRRAELGQPFAVARRRAGNDGARFAGKADQRTGFHRLKPNDASLVRPALFGLEIEHLAADHAAGPCGAGQCQHQRCPALGRQHCRLVGKDVEGKRQQGVAGKNGGRFIESPVHGRLATAHIVIVHGRQIVMDERIAVHAFERCRDAQRRLDVG